VIFSQTAQQTVPVIVFFINILSKAARPRQHGATKAAGPRSESRPLPGPALYRSDDADRRRKDKSIRMKRNFRQFKNTT
jgi:hypothetical protein